MKARVEGIRALAVKLAHHQDSVQRAARQGRSEGRLPPGPGRPAGAAGEGVRQRPGLPRLRDGDPDVRRRRLHAGLPRRAVLPRREDLQHLRGHEPHPGDGSRRAQARTGGRREPAGLPGRRRALRAEAHGATPTLGPRGEDARRWRRRRSAGSAMRLLMWFQTGKHGDGAPPREPLPRDDGRDRRSAGCSSRAPPSRWRRRRASPRGTRTRRSTRARSPPRCSSRATCSRPSSSRRS